LRIRYNEVDRCKMDEGIAIPKVRVSITLPKECVEWLDEKVRRRIYANRSHAIEVLILREMEREKG